MLFCFAKHLYVYMYVHTRNFIHIESNHNTNIVYGFLVPDKVTGVDLVCFPVNMIIECNAKWDGSTFVCVYVCVCMCVCASNIRICKRK